MLLSQELQFILPSIIRSLPTMMVCMGLLFVIFDRRIDAPRAANYALVGVGLLSFYVVIDIIVAPYLPRLVSFVAGPLIWFLLPAVRFILNAIFATGLLLLGVAVFMDRQK
jgi:hypothetical protein